VTLAGVRVAAGGVPPAASPLPPDALALLAAAKAALEHDSLTARLGAIAGAPIETLKRRLPEAAQGAVDATVHRALGTALAVALRSGPGRSLPRLPAAWLQRGLTAASGAAGGTFGLAGTMVELPVSTTLLMRQIAAEAVAAGEDPRSRETAVECLKVFALGRPGEADDAVDAGYLATRLALARLLPNLGPAVLPGFLAAIAARLTGKVVVKLAVQAAPLVGAAAGATVNLVFLEHFRRLARAHFTIRRLEREHGAAAVRIAYATV
jgi:hypothetical protein